MTTLIYIPALFTMNIDVFLILLILAILFFFIIRWIFAKYIKNEKNRKIATWAVTLISIPAMYILIMMVWFSSVSYYPRNDFIKDKWVSEKEKRYELSHDIIESEMLIGLTKQEVRQLLGDEKNSDQNDTWRYYLGFRPGIASIDPDVLVIEFENGKVIKVYQHES